jgi:hypothetical protein
MLTYLYNLPVPITIEMFTQCSPGEHDNYFNAFTYCIHNSFTMLCYSQRPFYKETDDLHQGRTWQQDPKLTETARQART